MMTEQRKRRLRTKIQESRGRLMESHPFFSLLLMYLGYVAVPGMKKMSTNGRCVFFSPDFLDRLHYAELDYILCHQVMHILHGHIWRPLDLAGDDYHFACDIAVNSHLEKSGILKDGFSHLGYTHRSIPSRNTNVSEMTSGEIYKLLPYSLYSLDERTRSRFLADSELWWDRKTDSGESGEVILDPPEIAGSSREPAADDDEIDLRHIWQARAGGAAGAAGAMDSAGKKGRGIGDVPGFVKRMTEKMSEPTVDWKKVLHNFVQESVCDYSFSPPDRRFADTGFFLPDFNERDFVTKDILFMADTSGSVSDDELAAVYSEIRGAIEQFNGKLTGSLGFFDAEVIPPIPFSGVSDLLRIIPYGGGGTDFRVIFEYLRHRASQPPASVVIFTDGCGPYPDQTETMGIPVLWMINNSGFTPPWGKVVRVPGGEKWK